MYFSGNRKEFSFSVATNENLKRKLTVKEEMLFLHCRWQPYQSILATLILTALAPNDNDCEYYKQYGCLLLSISPYIRNTIYLISFCISLSEHKKLSNDFQKFIHVSMVCKCTRPSCKNSSRKYEWQTKTLLKHCRLFVVYLNISI